MTALTEELLALRALKDKRDAANKEYKSLDADFKREQARLIERMNAEGYESAKADGISFTPVKLEYGTVQDRQSFVQWALDNDVELIEYKERGEQLNAFVRRLLDDGAEFPPGLGFYEREYLSMRSS